jgi:mannose-1-phosphate guanylyltransferase
MKTLILCGGSGTRLWPLSRSLFPKQFYPLFENQSLYQQTLNRNYNHSDEFLIVINQEQYFMGLDQQESLFKNKKCHYILESVGRNTAPAIALAALSCSPEEILLVVPSDHLILNQKEYEKTIQRAKTLAMNNKLITFGINPTYPETGYGYIESSNEKVLSFKEKPSLEIAKTYLQAGNYFWNSGMFCFKAGFFLSELEKFAPEVFKQSKIAFEKSNPFPTKRILKELMMNIPDISIDYAVMEKSHSVGMVKAEFDWSDLGSFDSLYAALPKDKNGNTLYQDHFNIESKNNLIMGQKKFIATIGIEDLAIIDTPDALLISKRGETQKVKDVVHHLKNDRFSLTEVHTKAHRPWGNYTVLEDSAQFKVKKIEVNPGASLSLQKHAQRSEHWVVVTGQAKVTVGEKTFLLNKNESTYIPREAVHRLENTTKEKLVIIEAQVGDYLGEDDIVRLKDDYMRN